MAERKQTQRSSSGSSGSSRSSGSRSNSSSRSSSRSRAKSVTAGSAARTVREEFPQLLGRPIESLLGIERDDDDDSWQVTVQIVELERVPRTTDVLGAYVVQLDSDGEIVGYRRIRRYHRGQPDED